MDYEKKYKEALERAKNLQEKANGMILNEWLIGVFPELGESEDEKWIKWLIGHLSGYINQTDDKYAEVCKKAIAWLEKQGEQILANSEKTCKNEQKPADKVEQKFHEGEWVVYNNDICQIVKREEGCNKLVTVFGVEKELVNERNLSTARLWTIQDAKGGDVLYLQHEGVEHIIIYKGLVKKNFNTVLSTYCACNGCVHDFCFTDVSSYASITSERDEKEIHPATKEQRDMLFQKMKEAGYEWDTEKKELKEIEPKPATYEISLEYAAKRFLETLSHSPYNNRPVVDAQVVTEELLKFLTNPSDYNPDAINMVKSEQVWSDEDSKMFNACCDFLTDEECVWLKSLKERLGGK